MSRDRVNGVMFAYMFVPSGGLGLSDAGPALHLIDLAYTWRPEHGEGLSLEVGPSIGLVDTTLSTDASGMSFEDVPGHPTLGGRVSVTFRTPPSSWLLFGVELGYRGGVPIVHDIGHGVPVWESTPFLLLGFGIQTARR